MLSSMQSVSAVFRRLSTLRTAVLALTNLTFLFSLAVCTGIWLILREFESLKDMYWAEGDVVAPVLTASQMGGIIPVGIMWTLLCAISIVGFVGAVKNHFRITSAYCTLVWTHYVVDFIVGLWFFYVLYSSSWRLLLEVCSEDKSADFHLDKTVCAIPESKLKAAYVGTFFVGKLIGFGFCLVASSYRHDLRKQSVAHLPPDHPIHQRFSRKPEVYTPNRRTVIQFGNAPLYQPELNRNRSTCTSYSVCTSQQHGTVEDERDIKSNEEEIENNASEKIIHGPTSSHTEDKPVITQGRSQI